MFNRKINLNLVPKPEQSLGDVIGVGSDCGNSYLIKFEKNTIGVPPNTSENIFYEINLPSQFKVNGLRINVTFRQPINNEIMNCTAQDFAYSQIFIESVN